MYSKLGIQTDEGEIIFEAHELVAIALSLTQKASDEECLIPLDGYFEQFISGQSKKFDDLDIIAGKLDSFITIPIFIGELDSIGKWLYVARELREGHDFEPHYGWWVNVGGRLLLTKNRYFGYTLDIIDQTKKPAADKKAWEKGKDTRQEFLIYRFNGCWYAYGTDYQGNLKTLDISEAVNKLCPDLCKENFYQFEDQLLEIVISSDQGLGHRQDYYISDHGLVFDVIQKTREIVFGVDWVNPRYVHAVVKVQEKISQIPADELPKHQRQLAQVLANAPMDELKVTHPDKSEEELREIQQSCRDDPQYADEMWKRMMGDTQYLIHTLVKKYCSMMFSSPDFSEEIIEDFGYEMGSKLIKRLVLLELMREVNQGNHEGLIRPMYSYGSQHKGDAYHDFERSVQAYLKSENALSISELATEMRALLKGCLLVNDALSFLPNLTVAWFVAEAIRNELSIMSGLMLLDLLESGAKLMNSDGSNWYTWPNLLIHPNKSKGEKEAKNLYGKLIGIDRFGGSHPMAHAGSVNDTATPLDTCQLKLIDGEIPKSSMDQIISGRLVIIKKGKDHNYYLYFTDDMKTCRTLKIQDQSLIKTLNKTKFSGEIYEKGNLNDPLSRILKKERSRVHFTPIQLPTTRQKEANLIIHWLSLKLTPAKATPISSESKKGHLEQPHNYDEIADTNNSSPKLRRAEKKIKRLKSDVKRLIEKGEEKKAQETTQKLCDSENERKRMKEKIRIQKELIEPLLQQRLSSLECLLPSENIRPAKFARSYTQLSRKKSTSKNSPLTDTHPKKSLPLSRSLEDLGLFGPDNSSDDEILAKVKKESKLQAEQEGEIGPREIPGWQLHDVEDIGNCFYEAVIDQMVLIQHPFLEAIPQGTMASDSLRLLLQGPAFKDKEWADNEIIDSLAKNLPVIIAIADSRHPETGFVCYYKDADGALITNVDKAFQLPDLPIIRLVATGNHFLSVRSHPALPQGTIKDPFDSTHEPTKNNLSSPRK